MAVIVALGVWAYIATQPSWTITDNGDDIADGGNGIDTVTFAGAELGVQVDLGAGTAVGVETGRDTLISIENVIGSAGADTIVGSADVNELRGGPGNDTLTGGLGNDLVDGGDGNDIAVFAGTFADYRFTQDADTLIVIGQDGTDIIRGIEALRFDDRAVLVQNIGTALSN